MTRRRQDPDTVPHVEPPFRTPLFTPALAAVAVALHLLPPAWAAALQFDRTAIEAGELWRLLTAHLTHFDANHLGWDVAVFAALGCACERNSRTATALTLLLAAGAISVGVWTALPEFDVYRGLSGLDCALFALLAGQLWHRPERAARLAGLAGCLSLGAKCVAEIAFARTLFASGAGYAPVPLAHLLGGAVGLLAARAAAHRSRRPSGESPRFAPRESLQNDAGCQTLQGHVGPASHHR